MKYLFHLLLVFPLLLSCGDGDEVEESTDEELVDNFTISGTIENAGNTSLYLEALSQQGTISVAEARTDYKGAFEMVGNIPGFGLYQLRLGESNDKIIPLTIVPNDKVRLKATFANFELNPKISGTSWSGVMTDYMQLFSNFHLAQTELMNLKDSLDPEVQC